jgi:UDP-2-acetamido-3-amino-2,3-dideoxy-glucuronate N-acetyltransferase
MIHPTAEVSSEARIGAGTKVWHQAQVREGAIVGKDCTLGKGAYVDKGVTIGDRVKLQNGVQVFHGSTLEDGVFVGPQAVLANDRYPRSITSDGRLKADSDWPEGRVVVRYGASIGAGAVIVPDASVGRWAMVGAGSVVVGDVPDHALVTGNPARQSGWVCKCGRRLRGTGDEWACPACGETYRFASAKVPS